MQFKFAIGALFTTLMWTAAATHVQCEAGLSDTNICEKTYCKCDGGILFCESGTTCLDTCICAA
ncbi:hypothetical protein PMIN06_000129 [Paraphaeosphaeria minitans]|uniref:Uncharacterized protein n=1 Tax=Paraphaeosphaeria minitans TaxID=565426 RepID=A0A9P6G529_9PLEO|nr:hypothetical protein PMIN01_12921 [Paraphaeosphaeria minitans]